MSDSFLIKNIVEKNKPRYGTKITDGDAFEFFCAETALKPFSLIFDEIAKGIVDGTNDGGIDSVYFFVNRSLIDIDTDMEAFKSPVTVDLFIIQSKLDEGFKEAAMSNLISSIPKLIDLGVDKDDLTVRFNSKVQEVFETYRSGLTELTAQFPTVNVHVIYATLASKQNAKVEAMVPDLKNSIEAKYPNSVCKIELWDARRLYQEAQKQNTIVRLLPYVKQPISHGPGYIILTELEDYYNFIDDGGRIIDSLFEFNVRDYQSGASVNKEIAASLADDTDQTDFWWLNNGITILAENAEAANDIMTIKNPIVVNGLQTSHEIHRFFCGGGTDKRKRSIQVRVLKIDDDTRRDSVIKATNSQTGIKPASLRATEPFQRKIEDFLFQLGIFYDRRKDFWRNKGKPANRIIGIEKLAQSVIAVLLERPHDARGRPTTLVKDDTNYNSIFAETTPLKIYEVCAQLYFLVDAYFKKVRTSVDSIYLNNLRYHVMMQLAWRLNGSHPLHPSTFRTLRVASLTDADIETVLDHTIKLFDQESAKDQTAKGEPFTTILKSGSLVPASTLSANS